MNQSAPSVRDHYSASALVTRLQAALSSTAPEGTPLTVAQLAPLDQFHTRGILATKDLAQAAGVALTTRVLDIGSGLGGPARFLAATYGCHVVGVDLSSDFVEAATYLTTRTNLAHRASFQVADALHLPFEGAAFDTAFLQHVAMNVEDRAALYAEIHRVLAPDGRFATFDIVRRTGDVHYPVPWARNPSTSFLFTEEETRTALEHAGFRALSWNDDTEIAVEWFGTLLATPPAAGLNLGLVMGPDFATMASNLAKNLREGRLGVLSAVVARD